MKKLIARVFNIKTGETIGEKEVEVDNSEPTYEEILKGGIYCRRHKSQEKILREFVAVEFRKAE